MILAFAASTADSQTHERSIFFVLEHLLLLSLSLIAIAAFAGVFYSKEERAKHRALFFLSLLPVTAASIILAYAGTAIYRILF